MNVLSLCFLCSSACKWRFLHKQFISDLKSRCIIIFRFYFLDDVMMTLSNTQSQTVCAGRRVCKLEKEQTAKSAKYIFSSSLQQQVQLLAHSQLSKSQQVQSHKNKWRVQPAEAFTSRADYVTTDRRTWLSQTADELNPIRFISTI